MEQQWKRVYVSVRAEFDESGTMLPRELTWQDGRVYKIERVLDVRRAGQLRAGSQGSRYLVSILGQQKQLFFEYSDSRYDLRPGRWFIPIPT